MATCFAFILFSLLSSLRVGFIVACFGAFANQTMHALQIHPKHGAQGDLVFFTTYVHPGSKKTLHSEWNPSSFLTDRCQEAEMSSQVSTKSIYEAMAREIEMEGEVQEGKVEEASHSLSRFCSILWDWGCPSEMAKAIDRSGLSQAGIGLGRPMLIHNT